jgi:hypothetical protein
MKFPLLSIWQVNSVLLLLTVCATQCQFETNQTQTSITQTSNDTVEVTRFDIERTKNSPELANWVVFEAGEEIICAPPNWQAQVKDIMLIISPPTRSDTIECITFSRLDKDSPKLNYNSFARKLAEKSFAGFKIQNGDTLKQLIFQRDFAYERNADLRINDKAYKGYSLVYVGDQFVYDYQIILAEERLKLYHGDLLADIIGNLQIGKQYIIGNDNPLKKMLYISRQ